MRELVAGGVYHAVARGNRGARIFRDDADYAEYLKLLAGVVTRFRWAVLAYCLMGNHVHLVVETPEPNLPAGMQWLHGKYGRYFNDRHDLFGHLFQGRYKAARQLTDEQLLYVLRYVGLNPVEAAVVPASARLPLVELWGGLGTQPPLRCRRSPGLVHGSSRGRRSARALPGARRGRAARCGSPGFR